MKCPCFQQFAISVGGCERFHWGSNLSCWREFFNVSSIIMSDPTSKPNDCRASWTCMVFRTIDLCHQMCCSHISYRRIDLLDSHLDYGWRTRECSVCRRTRTPWPLHLTVDHIAPIANSAIMSALAVQCRWEEETTRERTGQSLSYAVPRLRRWSR